LGVASRQEEGWALVKEGKGKGKEREGEVEGRERQGPQVTVEQRPLRANCYATGSKLAKIMSTYSLISTCC